MVKVSKETMHYNNNEKNMIYDRKYIKNVNIIISDFFTHLKKANRTGAYRKQLNWGKNN